MKKRGPLYEKNRERPSESSIPLLQYAGLHQMGVDLETLARGMGIGPDSKPSIQHIDRIANTYRMLVYGLPRGVYGELENQITCPRCGSRIVKVPCVSCCSTGAWPSKLTDSFPDLIDIDLC